MWQMEFLHPAKCHDHDIDFITWLHPAMWYLALESWQWIHQVAAPCNVIRGLRMTWHWICQVAAPCSVEGGSGITCHWIRPNVCHIGILHLVSISTSPQSTCHSAQSPKFYPNRTTLGRKKWSYLGFYRSNNGFFEKPNYNLLNCLFCQKIAFLHFGVNIQDDECPPSWILGVP